MKILLISDTHNKHNSMVIPDEEIDIVICSGDFTMMGRLGEVNSFLEWYKQLEIPHKVLIAGNHEVVVPEKQPVLFEELCNQNGIIYLNDSSVNIEGIKIHGSPVTPTFGYGWAFNRNRGKDIKKHWDLIEDGIDILVTHGPPHRILDGVERFTRNAEYEIEHTGCQDLADAIKRVKPQIHLFGHIHEGYGFVEQDGVKYYNASIVDRNYYPVNKPFIINL